MMHDFIVTKHHVIFMVCPATIRMENIEKFGSPLGWEPELGTRIGVMPRDGGSADVPLVRRRLPATSSIR